MNTEKKGELAELKASLRQLAGSRAPGSTEAKRELFKKVISYMTIGIDVSGLFTEMIMGSGATSDLVLKKMCYLYICSYAQSNSELALLTINFLQKDCQVSGASYEGVISAQNCGQSLSFKWASSNCDRYSPHNLTDSMQALFVIKP